MPTTTGPMVFRNFGGVYQLEVDDEYDMAQIDRLDPARWAATSAPVRDLQCDPAFLALLDPEKKGRIRVGAVLAARDWLFQSLASRGRLGSDALVLEDIAASGPEGARLRKAAEHVLREIGAKDRNQLTLAEVRAFRRTYSTSLANGDGIVCPEAIPDPEVARYVRDIMKVVGSARDLSGRPGVGAAELDRFIEAARAYAAWKAKRADQGILVFGPETEAAAALVEALGPKIEQYFWQCDLLRQEPRAAERMHLGPDRLEKIDVGDRAAIEATLAGAPLAAPVATGVLALDRPVNPLYEERFAALRRTVLARILGPDARELTRASWAEVKQALAPYVAWRAARPAEPVESIAEDSLGAYVSGPLVERLRALIAQDLAAASELAKLADLEKLILYQRWLVELINNFVNFSALYQPDKRALVDMGTIVIDGRRLELSVRVEDRAAHRKVAAESGIFLVYAAISDQDGKVAFEVAAPVTSGERGRIAVGRRGIFLGRDGAERDAVIVDVVENPISLSEAVWAPFRRASKFVARKIEDFASSKLAAAEKAAEASLAGAPPAAPPPAAAPAPAAGPAPAMTNLLLIGGFVVAGLSAALGFVVSLFASLGVSGILRGLASVAAVLIAVSAFVGWLKLRRRDMGVILEASGWALNLRMPITHRLGRFFTRVPPLPRGAKKSRLDALAPFYAALEDSSHRRRRRARYVAVAILVALIVGAYAAYKLGYVQEIIDRIRAE